MTHSTLPSPELDPQARRALLAELLQSRLEASRAQFPLTHGQQAMWFLHQLAPESSAYNVNFCARIRSAVDIEAVRRSLQALIDRHASLRTTYESLDGSLVQIVHAVQNVSFEVVDASTSNDAALYQQIDDLYRQPFNLDTGPVFRAALFSRSATDHVLQLVAHHIAVDGRSIWMLLEEFGEIYAANVANRALSLPALPAQYADFVAWQDALIHNERGQQLWEYWKTQLEGELPILDLPTDLPRPATQTFRGASLACDIDDELSEGIRRIAREEHTTPYVILLAAYQLLLHRYSGQDDILVGSPVAGRSRPEFANLVGDFINMVVMRAKISPTASFREFLSQTRETVVKALDHQDFPFPLVVERLAPKADHSRSPIFQAVINVHNVNRTSPMSGLFLPSKLHARVEMGGLTLEPYPMPQQEGQLDLVLQFVDSGTEFFGTLQYNIDLFEATTVERMVKHYRTLLGSIVRNPDTTLDAIPMLTSEEVEQITNLWNATDEVFPSHLTLQQFIEAQVDRTPEAVALRFAETTMSYRQLDEDANRLANLLQRQGIGRGDVVGVNLERSSDLLVALLGILKAGAAYLPLDPGYPTQRQAFVLADAGAVALLTTTELIPAEVPAHLQLLCLDQVRAELTQSSPDRPDAGSTPDDLAYLIYTSGSTGQPKGVRVPHRAIVNLLSTIRQRPGLTADDVLVAVTTVAFDIAALELFLPLTVGAQLVLTDRATAQSGRDLLTLIEATNATVIQATPVTFRLLLQNGLEQATRLRCWCGGEAMPSDLAADLLAAGVELWNMYGPTETTVWSTIHRVEQAEAIVPVGRPIGNTRVYVLNPALQPVPPGVVGELYIGGAGVTDGYHERPALTGERFIADPFAPGPNARMYRTGDLARFRSDGTLVVLGRTDHQVKLRGYRIELGEIEAVISDQADVREAVVSVRLDRQGAPTLVAYLTTASGNRINPGSLRTALRQRLPEYMVPSAFVFLHDMPLTPNGKIDRAALPDPLERRIDESTAFVPPTTPTEQVVARIWTRILALPRISLLDTFFDLGGHSLQAVEAIAATEQELGVRPNPILFQTQTLGQFAATCDAMIARGEIHTRPEPPPSTLGRAGALRRLIGMRTR